MVLPKLKKINTVGIRFTKGQRKDAHYEMIIEGILKVQESDIAGIAEMGPKRFMLKVSTHYVYQDICRHFIGKTLKIDDDHEFEIDDLSTYKHRVRVRKVPFEMNDYALKSLMERYGRVENINPSYKRYGSYERVLSDERIVWMIVDFSIPSSLYITDSQTFMFFSYIEQPQTCHKCGD